MYNNEKGRVRFTVDLPVAIEAKLEERAKKRGVKKSELLRTSIKLLVELDDYTDQGYKVGAWKRHEDGTLDFVQLAF